MKLYRCQQNICLLYSNQNNVSKRYKDERYCLSKGTIKNYNVIINDDTSKNFNPLNLIDSDVTQYEEIRKLTRGQGEDYTI